MSSISLLISPFGVESIDARLDPERDTRVNAYRLVHEQQGPGSDVRWFFFAKADLSKPEAMTRAQQWYETSRHPDWPGFRH
ncbi:hypothetical protein MMG85_08800 [Pseudoxanthomonas sp. LH2527]|uniref:hypothetical protein n=1 Tax=Pseudoxanthomonas sp. LH2527 TaxID=2923249 RepID=UPI001F139C9A|nr:hypothetical protein [Pseudoxanthomonas sp. LH2527]MCH6483663.1 hypothetical protein [Pseudoxanthomonas sp. LH2527]